MVIFQTPGGSPGYNQFETLDDAVAFVEQLRNDRDVTNARMFALEEIKFDLKPYFKVELQALNAGPSTDAAPAAPAPPAAAPAPEAPAPSAPAPPPPAEPAAAPAANFGAFSESQTSESPAAPAAPAPEPEAPKEQPARRGLFGR